MFDRKIKFVSFLMTVIIFVSMPMLTMAQEFDWDDDTFIQTRKSNNSRPSSSSNLPGVSNDPFAAKEARKFCNRTSLAEALSNELPSKRCPRNNLTLFELQTDKFINSPK